MPKIFDPTELSKYGGLALVARQVVEGFLTGVHRSPFKGYSVEFAEHRQYYPGDEIRHIDWRALAKTDRVYIKEYEDETNLKAVMVVDASGSMAYRGGQTLSKWDYARHVAASFGYLLLHQLDAVGLLLHDSQPREFIPPKASSKHLLQILNALEKTEPGGETSLAACWEQIASRHLKKRGLVAIFSDCFDKIEPLSKALRHLRHRHHEVILFQILAPEEMDFPFKRSVKFRDMELGEREWAVDAAKAKAVYQKNFGEHQAALRKVAAELGIDLVVMRTDRSVERALGEYLMKR